MFVKFIIYLKKVSGSDYQVVSIGYQVVSIK